MQIPRVSTIFIALSCSMVTLGQTTVTTTGGNSGALPLFTGTATIGASSISQSSNGYIGFGTSSPASRLDIITNSEGISIHGDSIGFNREITTGAVFNPSGYAYQLNHVYNTENTLDYLALQVNTPSGSAVSNSAWVVNGAGNVGIHNLFPHGALDVTTSSDTTGNLTAFGPQHFVVGAGLASGSGSGGIFLSYDQTNDRGYIGAVSPSVTWRSLILQPISGNVGIGTATPGVKLEVDGSVKLTSGSGASMTFQDGSVQTVAWNGVLSGGDYAESVDVTGERSSYEPGDVLVIDPDSSGHFLKCATPYSTSVAGIYSTNPGVRGRRQKSEQSHMKQEVPMAMIGVVPTKVTAENGPIKRGDLLVTSSRPGYAMKGSDRTQVSGAVVGKAMDNLNSGTGLIEVLVSLQ